MIPSYNCATIIKSVSVKHLPGFDLCSRNGTDKYGDTSPLSVEQYNNFE